MPPLSTLRWLRGCGQSVQEVVDGFGDEAESGVEFSERGVDGVEAGVGEGCVLVEVALGVADGGAVRGEASDFAVESGDLGGEDGDGVHALTLSASRLPIKDVSQTPGLTPSASALALT